MGHWLLLSQITSPTPATRCAHVPHYHPLVIVGYDAWGHEWRFKLDSTRDWTLVYAQSSTQPLYQPPVASAMSCSLTRYMDWESTAGCDEKRGKGTTIWSFITRPPILIGLGPQLRFPSLHLVGYVFMIPGATGPMFKGLIEWDDSAECPFWVL